MTTYTVSGFVPTPMYDPKRPVFTHDPSTAPPRQGKASHPRAVGESDRLIEVTTTSKTVAETLKSVLGGGKDPILEDVEITDDSETEE